MALTSRLSAQEFGRADAVALVERAIEKRALAFADSSLRDWKARAHGFVFFLGQIGEGLAEPPRLVKADQLELEVYWQAPNLSRQRIIGWRDQRDLPTDINYHRDHLGIVMNNFPDLIRLGDGDEVRDVPHPVSRSGMTAYEFAWVDSSTIRLPGGRELRVHELRFRPRDFSAPRIVGSIFLEITTADLVRMTFSFTRAAYRDDQLEDITVAVENSLWGERFWLPLRQEIEIRRRGTWLDFPARGIIRGRFEIDGYRFNEGIDPAIFRRGAEIVVAPQSVRDSFAWNEPLEAAIRDIAGPSRVQDFDAVRAEAVRLAMGHTLTGLRRTQVAGASVSDLAHINRVEGLAVGAGITSRSANQARELRVNGALATARWLPTGAITLTGRRGASTFSVRAERSVRDIGDFPVISRAVNSLSAQETGRDFGDYYLLRAVSVRKTRSFGSRSQWYIGTGWEWIDTLDIAARWSRGEYSRPNTGAATDGNYLVSRLGWRRQSSSFAPTNELSGRTEIEVGGADRARSDYGRFFGEVRWQVPAGSALLVTRVAAGFATPHTPAHRAFVIGGRGTLLGEPFRGRGGRRMAWISSELAVPVPIPELALGSFAGTGRTLTLSPNVALGWTGSAAPGLFALPGQGIDASVGLGVSVLHDLIRLDAGYGIRSRKLGFSIDVAREFWDIL